MMRINSSILCFQLSRRVGLDPWRPHNLQSDIQCESDNVYFAMLVLIVIHFCLVFIQVQSAQEASLSVRLLLLSPRDARVPKLFDIKPIPDGCGSAVVTPTILVHTLVRVSVGNSYLTDF